MSRTAAPRSSTAPAARPPESVTFAISRLAYFTVLVTLIVVVMMMGVSIAWFGWTLIVPLLQIWWIRRVRTVADADGLTAVHTFGTTSLSWDDVAGLRFPTWSAVRAVRRDGETVRLRAVTFADLPVLAAISGGRVPDPYAAAREAALAERDAETETDSD